MRIAYLDCFSGAAGDMLVGACLDAGVPLADLERELERLGLSGYALSATKVRRQAIAGTWFRVGVGDSRPDGREPAHHAHGEHRHEHPGGGVPHRHLADIEACVRRAGWPAPRQDRMLAVFRALATAEAAAHGIPVADVHFHEVGALDSIIDVCATVLAFDMLGVQRAYASEVVTGEGLVRCAHGTMPVPAPGTLQLLAGIPVRTGGLPGERCTPTGAALLRVLVDEFAPPPTFRPRQIGYGAGTRDDGPVPNLLRLVLGDVAEPAGQDWVWELALQVDNVSGEVLGHALRAAVERGALDAWATPTITKKNRPAHWVVVLSDDAHRDLLEQCLLSELPSLGLRRHRVERRILPRRIEQRDTPFGRVSFKVRTLPDGSELAHPEADDVERLAREHGLPVPVVLARLGGAG